MRPNCTAKGDIRTAKALPCVDARQRPHGEGLPGKGFFAVRLHQNARQSLCRAASSLPSATTRRRAVDVAVRRLHLPCVGHCRAPSRRTHGKDLLFAVRHPTARTAKAVSLPCAPVHPHGKEPTRHTPGQPQHCLCRADAHGQATKMVFGVGLSPAKAPGF